MAKKWKRPKVEIKSSCKGTPKNLVTKCLCCDKQLEGDKHAGTNAENFPIIYGGVVFRSSGNFGSTVLDCGVGIPQGWESDVQIIICDECLLTKASQVNARRNKRGVIERRPFADVPVEWSDYSTFEEMRKAEQQALQKPKAKKQ